jgi:hypothetical protein
MTQHDEPQPAAEAVVLQPAARHAHASISKSLTATLTTRSPCLATPRGTVVPFAIATTIGLRWCIASRNHRTA